MSTEQGLNTIVGQWTAGPSMTKVRWDHTSTCVDGKIYAIGGITAFPGGSLKTMEVYDISTNTWSNGPNMTINRSYHTITHDGGKIYAIGGTYDSSHMEIYDISTNQWLVMPGMIDMRTCHTSTCVDGKIYVIGGGDIDEDDRFTPISSMEIYDIATGTWSTGASLRNVRSTHTAEYVDGKIYVMGGVGNNEDELSTMEIYDISTNTWSEGPNMTTARYDHTSEYVDGKIYVIGGTWDLSPVEIYDISTNTWSEGPSVTMKRICHTSEYVDGKIYVIGGAWDLSSVEIYDISTNTWSEGPNMTTARYDHTSEYVDGKIYVIGGSDLSSMEVYDTGFRPIISNTKNAILQKKIEGVIYDIMMRTTSSQVMMADGTTLTEFLADYITTTEVDTKIQDLVGTAPEALNTLGEIAEMLSNNADLHDLIQGALTDKVDKVDGKGLSTEDFTSELKTKLDALNNYIHPENHPATMITQDETHRFVADTEKTAWNAKAETTPVTTTTDGLMGSADKAKLDNVEANANNYVHPETHSVDMIAETTEKNFVTTAEKAKIDASERILVGTTTPEDLEEQDLFIQII